MLNIDNLDPEVKDAFRELFERLEKAESQVAHYKQVVEGEVLRLSPGDLLVVRMDVKWLGGSRQYDFYRDGLRGLLPHGVQCVITTKDVSFEAMDTEKLASIGLVRAGMKLDS